MMTIREYKRAESLEEAWQLNQKKANRILGGMIWLKMETINVGTAIDPVSYTHLDVYKRQRTGSAPNFKKQGRFVYGTVCDPFGLPGLSGAGRSAAGR